MMSRLIEAFNYGIFLENIDKVQPQKIPPSVELILCQKQ